MNCHLTNQILAYITYIVKKSFSLFKFILFCAILDASSTLRRNKMRYIAFDVETPNHYNNRISAIGISVVEGDKIIGEFYTLVDPEAPFDRFNVELTHITPEMVDGEPNFYELWQVIEPIMSSGLLIAHNAVFDMSVLSKCLNDYGIEWQATTRYACTCQMGKKCLPNLENHRLDTMCRSLGLGLDHHNAGSDSHACAELLIHYIKSGYRPEDFSRPYDVAKARTIKK